MTEYYSHLQIFSTPISVVKPQQRFSENLDSLIVNLLSLRSLGRTNQARSLKGHGWRMDNPHKEKGMEVLNEYIRWLVKSFLQYYKVPIDSNYSMASWVNLHDVGGYNSPHHHDPALVSGVIYLAAPPGSGNLIIRDPRPALSYAEKFPIAENQDSKFTNNPLIPEANFEVTPFPGLAVLFPGWLEHSVAPSSSNEPRVSVAFNLMRLK